MKLSVKMVDTSAILSALDTVGEIAGDVARTMAYESAAAVRDSAKAFVNDHSGRLKDNIYAAYVKETSTDLKHTYAVSWNQKNAPHGRLLEFGHWQVYGTYKLENGDWVSSDKLRRKPKWISAKPFLRPGYDTVAPKIGDIARAAGQKKYNALRTKK